MNDILSFIKSRRSTRKYKEKMIPDEYIQQIVEAGRYAPSGGNNQTTHFLVVKNKDILQNLAILVQKEFAKMEITPSMYKSMLHSITSAKTGNYVFHYHAPVLIITANKKDYGNSIADCSCALENMMLMANGLDLGSCWINQLKWLNENAVILAYLKELGLAEDERVYGALSIGYADTESGLPNRELLKRTGNPITIIE